MVGLSVLHGGESFQGMGRSEKVINPLGLCRVLGA